MFAWLFRLIGAAAAKKTYRAKIKQARQDAVDIVDNAKREAVKTAEETVRVTRTSLLFNANAEASRIVQEAEQQAEAVREEARDRGYKNGRKDGKKKGIEDGTREGTILAMQEVYKHFGLSLRVDNNWQPPAREDTWLHPDNLSGVRPNIYINNVGTITVRIVDHNGKRHVVEFAKSKTRETKEEFSLRLCFALHARLLTLPLDAQTFQSARDDYYRLWVSCLDTSSEQSITDVNFSAAWCFYYRLSRQQILHDIRDALYIGRCPATRFTNCEQSLLTEPWTVLFDKIHQRKREAFDAIGLGGSYSDRPTRTVRDLLYITPAELEALPSFGPVSVRAVQQALAHYNLALWGDPLQAVSSPRGERRLRGIDLT